MLPCFFKTGKRRKGMGAGYIAVKTPCMYRSQATRAIYIDG